MNFIMRLLPIYKYQYTGLLIIMLYMSVLKSYAQAPCTYNISQIDNNNYTINAGQSLCIDANGIATGVITLNGGTINNSGLIVPVSLVINSGLIENQGQIQYNGSIYLKSTSILNNYGSIKLSGQLLIDPTAAYYGKNATSYFIMGSQAITNLIVTPITQTICSGSSATITAIGCTSYSLNGVASPSVIVVTPSVTTTYTIAGLFSSVVYTTTSTVSVSSFRANAGADEFVNLSDVVTLGGSPSATGGSAPYTYAWLPSASYIPSNSVANPTITASVSQTYTLTVTDNTGMMCKDDKLVYLINEPYFLTLTKTLDAGYYHSFNSKIYFTFDEEYFDPAVSPSLTYKIVSDDNTVIPSALPTKTEKIGDNRFQLDLSALSLTQNKFYRISITNEKNEVWYARFKYQ